MKASDKLRLGHVKRWNIVNTTREQTVAEHSALVQLIALDVLRLYSPNALAELQFQTMRWALWHDVPEVFIGDMPTPIKNEIEKLHGGVFDEIEKSVCPEYSHVLRETPEVSRLIVKFADMFEACNFLSENGAGPRATEVMYGIGKRISDFIEELEDGFHHSLAQAMKQYIEEFPSWMNQ